MSIKAIETRYKGYRFRSRLEARWAVFFENAGIEWLYEPQGFVTPYGPYLPDFHLPKAGDGTGGVWVEVKPKSFEEIELAKLGYVVSNCPRSMGAALVGDPVDMYAMGGRLDLAMLQTDGMCTYCWYSEARRQSEGASVDPVVFDGLADANIFDGQATFYSCPICKSHGVSFYGLDQPCSCLPWWEEKDLVTNAALTARSARFEHGEVPA